MRDQNDRDTEVKREALPRWLSQREVFHTAFWGLRVVSSSDCETRVSKVDRKKPGSVASSREGDGNPGDSADRATGRILVVDDEESIRVILADILNDEGHDVTSAANGRQAIDLLESGTFSLIITDCNMPGAGGLEVVAAAKRVDPRCPIIVTSGHPSSEGEMRLIGHPRAVFLPKPFGAELILRTVAELLSA